MVTWFKDVEEAGLIVVNYETTEVKADNPRKHFYLEKIKIKEKNKDGRSFYINFRILNKEMQFVLILRQSFLEHGRRDLSLSE